MILSIFGRFLELFGPNLDPFSKLMDDSPDDSKRNETPWRKQGIPR